MSDNDWKKRLGVVFSTNPDFEYDKGEGDAVVTLPPSQQKLRIALDRRNRAGKQVTVVSDFIGSDDDLKELCKSLKTKCGVGGSAKEGLIVIQGDQRSKIAELLLSAGYKARVI